jgi:hypothetical protein
MNNMARVAEAEYAKLRYNGERRRHNFDTYVASHIKIHNTFRDLAEYGYSMPDERSRVRRLVDGILQKDCQPIKGTVYADQQLAGNFDAVVTLFKDFIAQSPNLAFVDNKDAVQIGAVDSDKGDGINWDTSDVKVDLRHHTREEYSKLTGPQKLKLKRWRESQPDFPVGKATAYNPNNKLMKKVIAMMSSTGTSAQKATNNNKKQKKSPKRQSNRNNVALTKQKKAPKSRGEDEDEMEE